MSNPHYNQEQYPKLRISRGKYESDLQLQGNSGTERCRDTGFKSLAQAWHRQGDLQTLTIPATLFLSTDTNS